LSARLAFTIAKSPKRDSSIRYFLPLKTAVGLGFEEIYTSSTGLPLASLTISPFSLVFILYFIGNPPVYMMVSTPVAV